MNIVTPNPAIASASLLADSLALGPHWIYEPEKISLELDPVLGVHAPLAKYHGSKQAGDFTHYGDQAFLLLRSIAGERHWDFERFAADWRMFWEDPANLAYRDAATVEALEQLQAGIMPSETTGSSSELGGASRIAPLFALGWASNVHLKQAVAMQTGMTHGKTVVEAGSLIVDWVLAVREGASPAQALEEVAASHDWEALPYEWFALARESASSKLADLAALTRFGVACDLDGSLQCVFHLALRYPEDPRAALSANSAAGGDCAARGMVLGMIYAAGGWMNELMQEFGPKLNAAEEIAALSMELEGGEDGA